MLDPLRKTIRFSAFRDGDADVWVATSDDRITAEARTREDLQARLTAIVPDVLNSRGIAHGPLTIVIDWQDPRTSEQTTFALA